MRLSVCVCTSHIRICILHDVAFFFLLFFNNRTMTDCPLQLIVDTEVHHNTPAIGTRNIKYALKNVLSQVVTKLWTRVGNSWKNFIKNIVDKVVHFMGF